ncbi:MAG: U32 family peptidase, partial [Deltaproteobacteria bacterium]
MAVAHRPEVLAPAGDHDALRAALAAGADAVYFGLDDGFNARARAKNFAVDDLDGIVRACHRAGARAFLTLNTLVFEEELPLVEEILRRVGASGVDALIVQDPAVALLAARVCPELDLHASTQMTISSPEAARFAERLGVIRVVLPRELSVEQIRTFRAGSALELEVFAHGALCMSWSGQCLTSEAWGGRSANRGQCAQSCRLPYGLLVDGVPRDLGEVRYLLSPSDLAAHEVLDELVEAGVQSLKVEGRLKGPAYVETAVASLHHRLDAVARGDAASPSARAALADELAVMHRVYSRGFTAGFLGGTDHQRLVDGRHPKHRGSFLGRVVAIRPGADGGAEVVVREAPDFPILGRPGVPAETPLEPVRGMGVVFDLGDPQDPNEPGGAIFSVRAGDGPGERWVLGFARDPALAPDLARVRPGHRVWINSDPAAEAHAQRAVKGPEPSGR